MKKIFVLCFVLALSSYAKANDSLSVILNKKEFNQGDTISVECYFQYAQKQLGAATLNVWIEDIYKNKRWKYRYPLLNGFSSFDLIIDKNLPEGKYALNFLVQEQFFSMTGKVRDFIKKEKTLSMLMLSKGKKPYANIISTDDKGNFSIGKIAFADTARFIFKRVVKLKADLILDIETPLDSIFTPHTIATQFVTIGKPDLLQADTMKPYTFSTKEFSGKFTLAEVIVKSTKKKLVEQFDEENSRGIFSGYGKVFDGLESDEIAKSPDVFNFLTRNVLDFTISYDSLGSPIITRRGYKVALYLDEFRVDGESIPYINPADIAMIKVFSPGEGMAGVDGGGAVAIYTKQGKHNQNGNRKNYFFIAGYNATTTIWK